jgi:hypothetical protein
LPCKLDWFVFTHLSLSWRRPLILLIVVFDILWVVCGFDYRKVRVTLLFLFPFSLHEQLDFLFNIFASIFYIFCYLFISSWISRTNSFPTILSSLLLTNNSLSAWRSWNLTIDRRRSDYLSNWPLHRFRKLSTNLPTRILTPAILNWLIRLYSSPNIINWIISFHPRKHSHRLLQLGMNNRLLILMRRSPHKCVLYLLILTCFWRLDYLREIFSQLVGGVRSSHLIQILRFRRLIIFGGW